MNTFGSIWLEIFELHPKKFILLLVCILSNYKCFMIGNILIIQPASINVNVLKTFKQSWDHCFYYTAEIIKIRKTN